MQSDNGVGVNSSVTVLSFRPQEIHMLFIQIFPGSRRFGGCRRANGWQLWRFKYHHLSFTFHVPEANAPTKGIGV
jgi:hypothetical protein